jgi:RNA polymerase sigma-70 factor, ECF subfamily
MTKDDKLLLRRSQRGDPEAFAELIKKHEGKIYGVAHHMCSGMKSEAEDIFQDTFVKAFEKIKQFRGDADFGTWLYRIALNECWQRFRKKERTPVIPLLDTPILQKNGEEIAFDPPDESALPEKLFEQKELKDIMDKALHELPETYRIALVMRDVQGLSNEETAKILGETVASIKSRVHRGRLYLRDKLIRYFSGRKKHPWTAKN